MLPLDKLALFGMPPPYFPVSSAAVMLLLALVAAVPPVLVFYWRRRWHVPKRHLCIAALIALFYIVLVVPELVRLAAFQGALQLWLEHGAVIAAVSSLAVLLWLKRGRHNHRSGR